MSEKKKIQSEYIKKINLLKKYNKFYFINDAPQISDSEYDKIKKNLLELEKKNPYLKKLKNISNIIGAPPSNKFKKIRHLKPMLSLSNAFEKKDMEDFQKKINNYLNTQEKKNRIIL